MTTTVPTAAAPILALDLGKYKSGVPHEKWTRS